MNRILVFAYALICYAIGFFALLYYADFFIGNFVVKHINAPSQVSPLNAFLINLGLLVLFCIPHSIMARPKVKAAMRRTIPYSMERSTYILVSSMLLLKLCYFWQPIPTAIFDLTDTFWETVFWGLYAMGWGVALLSTFLIDHLDLFGLKQAWKNLRKENHSYKFLTPLFYKLVRHPIYLGWLILHWFNPYFSVGQLLLASGITLYIYIGISYEEKDLEANFGDTYRKYKEQTPKVIPALIKRKS